MATNKKAKAIEGYNEIMEELGKAVNNNDNNINDIEFITDGPCLADEFPDEDAPAAIDNFVAGLDNLKDRFRIEIDALFQEYDDSLDSSENIEIIRSSLNGIQNMIEEFMDKVDSFGVEDGKY